MLGVGDPQPCISRQGRHGWSFWLMGIGMVAFWGLVISAVCALVMSSRRHSGAGHTSPPRVDAHQILDERLACAAIDHAEYRHLIDVMGSGHRNAVDADQTVRASNARRNRREQ